MKKIVMIAALFCLFGLLVGCQDVYSQKPAYGKAEDFVLKDINGGSVKLSDSKGKIIILNFFATWCPPCKREMPDFNEIAKEYKGKVEIIAVNIGRENAAALRKFAQNNKLEFPVLIDDGKVSSAYGPIRYIPVTVIIDKSFNIARKYTGSRTRQQLAEDIEELSR